MRKTYRGCIGSAVLAVICTLTAPAAALSQTGDGPVAAESRSATAIVFSPLVEYHTLTLTVSGPGDFHRRRSYGPGETPTINLLQTPPGFPDGQYTFELVAAPVVDPATRTTMDEARESGSPPASPVNPTTPLTGYFRVSGGAMVNADAAEEEPAAGGIVPQEAPLPQTDQTPIALADQVILDDLIVDGSACIGFDCVNGEPFGFDTIRIKENNLRIRAVDTSNSASFPSRDWQITFNDSSNGGANKFSIDDIDGGRTPFTLEAGAPSHSLYVDDGGRLGLGTSTPVSDIHVKSGNTPTLRLEQDGSSGFAPQTWDVAGNETNFFIRDATNGSTLPIRLRPGAPTSAIDIEGTGDIGFGTASPTASLHVRRTNGTASVLIEETQATSAARNMMEFKNNGPILGYTMTGTDAAPFSWTTQSHVDYMNWFYNPTPGVPADEVELMKLENDGDLLLVGTVQALSDRNRKENIHPVEGDRILAMLASVPIATWNYKHQDDSSRHMGPMAQDFREAFGLGSDDKTISLTDLDGVALAAIQELYQRLSVREAEMEELRSQNFSLTERLAALEAMVGSLVDGSEPTQ